ncbi:SDR family NAD(P)-dependent oxidoreductase [Winogradskyella vidalii]|uniref:SDR family NAD(P)-dependent oxidoreductase n=1 Tax=Winogradskyella vidalii TaxID=2615024 RepID=UPI0015CDCB26|nr:SDR family NAD(P)-dependent oxidoreductase [Winogradskyella vidalii]
MKIQDKVIWITGGCSGMGLASMELFLSKGAKVMVTDINEEKGKTLTYEYGANVIFYKADMTKTDELQAAVNGVMSKWGRLDVLLACAGGGGLTWALPMAPTPESVQSGGSFNWQYTNEGPGSLEAFVKDININLIGNFDAGRLAAFEMMKNKPNEKGERGAIIFISSISANKRHSPGFNCGYASSKAGLLGLTKEMSVNFAPGGIRVNSILPGFFDTKIVEEIKGIAGAQWQEAAIFPKEPGDPKCVATMATEIVENYFVNNATIEVTAGFTATASYQ